MMDIVTIGETMILFQPVEEKPLQYTSLFSRSIGGAESNVAIGLSRLGKRTRWIGRLGNDPFGGVISGTLASEHVDISKVIRDETHSTSVYFKDVYKLGDPSIYYYRKGSASSEWRPEHVQDDWFIDAQILHMTGITPALGDKTFEFTKECMKRARQLGLTISFDPNIRFKLWDRDIARRALLELIPLCDIFLPGLEEAQFLLGHRSPMELGEEIVKLGPHTVAIKLGEDGAFGMKKNGTSEMVQGLKVNKVIDTVGAGDAFTSGFLAVVADDVHEFSLKKALEWGNKMGSIVIQGKGDWEILPSLYEMKGNKEIIR
ncbi:sugar kinase [Heyndrickxia oleronia]|uniref:Sugar kinase n=1 Tax=Heyndrickxia oleronia TaxID=38875 RepID=A0AAW6T148_9BACI|nr:sugar kinase [Heyndrickxia oleronia]MDH5161976.1 sugar kinase [Heyndrickxia oleronia]